MYYDQNPFSVTCILSVNLYTVNHRLSDTTFIRTPKIGIFRGCRRLFLSLSLSLYCFHFDFRYVTVVRYNIYIICVPTHNRNNEFILEFILREIKMADFER